MIQWAANCDMPVRVLLTKADKFSNGQAKTALLKVRKDLQPYGALVQTQLFSALKGTGLDDLKEQLDIWLDATEPDEELEEEGAE
jgi:GTP-binding protein